MQTLMAAREDEARKAAAAPIKRKPRRKMSNVDMRTILGDADGDGEMSDSELAGKNKKKTRLVTAIMVNV